MEKISNFHIVILPLWTNLRVNRKLIQLINLHKTKIKIYLIWIEIFHLTPHNIKLNELDGKWQAPWAWTCPESERANEGGLQRLDSAGSMYGDCEAIMKNSQLLCGATLLSFLLFIIASNIKSWNTLPVSQLGVNATSRSHP